MNKILGLAVLLTGLVIGSGMDIQIDIPKSYQIAVPGESLWFTLHITGAKNDTSLNIIITDLMNRTLTSKKIIVQPNDTSRLLDLAIPDDADEGPYLLKINSGKTHSQAEFKVAKDLPESMRTIDSSLFDIFIDIPKKFKVVRPGEDLITSIKLINVGSSGRIDVFLDYTILDPEKNTILKRRETVAVETQANFVRTFNIPKDTPPGTYHIYAQVVYANGKFAVTDDMFEVSDNGFKLPHLNIIALGSIALAILILITMLNKRGFTKMKVRMRVARIVKRKQRKN